MKPDVMVVGAGWSGLTAAVLLARRGLTVRVLDASTVPGGRARSFTDRTSGETLDSGQHLMLGCYSETLELLRILGTGSLVRTSADPVPLLDGNGSRARFHSARLPGALHMLPSLLYMRHLPVRDRLALGRASASLLLAGRRDGLDTISAFDWLTGPAGQSARAMRLFWDPLVTAMLNEEPRSASAAMLVVVLGQGLLAGHEPSRPLLPRVGLGDLVARPAVRLIEEKGGEVIRSTRVRGLVARGRTVLAVRTSSGEMEASSYVLAVPSWRLGPILEGTGASRSLLEAARGLRPSPIVTVFLRFRRPIIDAPFAGLLGGRFHWLFDRNSIEPGPPHGQWSYAAVASAARSIVDRTSKEIADMAVEEIIRRVPSAERSLVTGARVVKDRRATFSPSPGTGALRPKAGDTGLGNLVVAGDWTDTGLPATLEGAVVSGRRSADLLARRPGSVRYRNNWFGSARTAPRGR